MKPTQDEVNVYLDSIRAAGVVNMFGAGPYIQDRFDVTRHEARDYLLKWMDTFGERVRKGEVVE